MGSPAEKGSSMNPPRVQPCLDSAANCEQRAAVATDPTARATFTEAATFWRELAKQIEWLEAPQSK